MKKHLFSLSFIIAVVTLLMASLTGCRRAAAWHLAEGAVWNTSYRITYSAPADLNDSIQNVFRQVESSLSPFSPTSLISRINRDETDSVDALISRVFAISQEVSRRSMGRFDPTVSPIVNLWKFGYTGKVDSDSAWEPTEAQIDSAISLVGILDCSISPQGRMSKKAPGTSFNFSAVTKGYACDLILEMLQRNGCTDAMVEIGGEVAVCGSSPRGDSWRLQIDAPVLSADSVIHQPLEVVEVADCGIATSGNYRNFHLDSAGRRVGHTINPLSGRPAISPFLSVTVIAPSCAEADACATALMATPSRAAADTLIARLAAPAGMNEHKFPASAQQQAHPLRVILVEADTILRYNWH